jgi:hypothetical protein
MRLLLCVLLLTFVVVKPASAQLCTGNPSFRDRPYQVGGAVSLTEGFRAVEGTFAAGGESFFAGAGVSAQNFTDIDVRTVGLSAFAGAEFAVDGEDRILLCPVIRLDFAAGPDAGPVDVSTASLQGGGSISLLAVESSDLMVVPFFGLAVLYQRINTDVGSVEASASDTGGVADLGVGFIFNRNVGITPIVSIPFAAASSDAVFTLRFTFNFGS